MNITSISRLMTRKRILWMTGLTIVFIGGYFLFSYGKLHKTQFAVESLNIFQKVSQFLPIANDTKAEIEAVNTLVNTLTKQDDVTRTFMIMLQNNYELRPGGGFLGQYAVLKVKNGTIISSFVEDANLLDQRITATITPPYPFKQIQLKKWKFRDSNFSPDFPTNAAKGQYFYRLAGGRETFDGVIAVNATVFDHILEITGPITMPGYGTYTSENGSMKLEENVEKPFLGDDIPAELKQNRKSIMKKIAAEIIDRISTLNNIPKLAEFAQTELRDRNVMLWFKDPSLQSVVANVHWDGSVATAWDNDYLMVVDANLGALKSDYWVKRSLDYSVDFTQGPLAVATVRYTYNHTATYGDWRTSDYHSYTRIVAPQGSKYVENSRLKTGGVLSSDSTEFNKTIFGYKVDAIMNHILETGISYTLPEAIKPDTYQLLIQKQSGIGTIPVTVHIKTDKGDFTQTADLTKDLKMSFQEVEEKQ